MTPSEGREQSIIRRVQQRPPGERAAFLDGACGDDAALRQRLEALLAAQAQVGGGPTITGPQAHTLVVEQPNEEGPDTQIGRYRVLEKIGEGGFGAVYVAEQREPVKRRVALKILKLGMDTRQVVARFQAERQALALMDHPNIAKVLDAGATEAGRPFFVMELVKGIPITQYCDQEKLGTQARLGLFIQVCHAIQHAHQKGIIHRDIKPSNILVTLNDGVPVPKVIDFGIAKATQAELTEKTVYTQFQQFIGTPAYMSPEQAEMSGLDIDTRSDIYSLGVLLYELLAGSTPFDTKDLMQSGLDEMRRIIREREPVRPSTRLRQTTSPKASTSRVSALSTDLDWVVMKCLEKDRTRRYETANGLARDIERHLNNEPVVARPPSNWYRLRKMVLRHKTTVAAAAAVTLTLVIGLAACVYLLIQEREERRRAVAAEQEQARLRQKAEAVADLEKTLRQRAEIGEKYSRAGMMLSRGQLEEPEKLVMELPPSAETVSFYKAFTMLHAQRGDWDRALTLCGLLASFCTASNSPLHESVPDVYHTWLPLLVQTGKLPEYRELRARVLREYAEDPDPVTCERLAKDCLMLPPETGQLDTLAKMADTAIAAGSNHRSWVHFEFAKGLAEYRRGRYQEAAEWLQKALEQKNEVKRTVQAYATLAMADYRLGQTDLARKTLAEGLALAGKALPPPAKEEPDPVWNDWIIARVLNQEATDLIRPRPPGDTRDPKEAQRDPGD